MVRRRAGLLACLLALLWLGGTGLAHANVSRGIASAPLRGSASVPLRGTAASVPLRGNGIDPAERGAVDGTLNYHEKRGYPYGLLVFLVVLTPVALVGIRRWTPKMDDGAA